MNTHLHRAPADCPVCGDGLITTRKGCPKCGTEIAGEFAQCEFCRLGEADLVLLRVFLASRGNLREVKRHLRVSYPTARVRLDAVLAKLGITVGGADPEEQATDGSGTAEQQILERVARGELSPEVAAQLLA